MLKKAQPLAICKQLNMLPDRERIWKNRRSFQADTGILRLTESGPAGHLLLQGKA